MRLAFAVLAIGLFAVPASAAAADRYAEPAGDGPEPCLQADPCSIGVAVNGAASPDVVTLLGGIPPSAPYSVAGQLSVAGGVTVQGAPGARPVVESSANVAFQLATGAVLRDVSIRQDNINGVGLVNSAGTVERVHSRTTGDWGCELTAGAVIRDSVCWTTTTETNDGAGLLVLHVAPTTASVVLRNVTAVGSQPGVPGLKALPLNASAVLTVLATNVIAQGGSTPDVVTTLTTGEADITFDHSNYDSEAEGGFEDQITDPGTGTNQTAAPVFNDAANGDFRQLATSTGTVDLGTAATLNGVGLGAFDLDGGPRSIGPAPDIGGDEGEPPPAPLVQSVDPPSPDSSLTPRIKGLAPPGSEVFIYTNDQCTGAAAASGLEGEYEDTGIQVDVAPGSQTTFWALSAAFNFQSECSSVLSSDASVTYSVIPTRPAVTGTDPATGANDNTPRIVGTGRSDSNSIEIYTAAGCPAQSLAASGTLAQYEGGGIEVSVPDNSTTTFYARAVGTYGDSACSTTSVAYTEVTPSAPPKAGERAAALKKCAKIKKKAKKKKCRKRARRLPV